MMPFVLMKSGATFQRMINSIVANGSNVKCWIENVVTHSATEEEQVVHLAILTKLLKKHGLRMRFKKCHFMQPTVELFGHYGDEEGLYVDEVKVEKIRNALRQRDRNEFRSLLFLALNFRRFIKNFAKIAISLMEKTSEKVEFAMSSDIK